MIGSWGTAGLRLLPPELAHEIGMWMLEKGLMDVLPVLPDAGTGPDVSMRVPGVGDLPHPIGLAAGFDKNARAPAAFAAMGFSFLELGTVTPRPQPGNPKPRIFRYPDQRAMINRMGFNSDGGAVVAGRLQSLSWDHDRIPYAVNVGKNKDTAESDALQDFLTGLETFRDLARFFVVNISSPNTAGLRNLASEEFIRQLATAKKGMLERIWIKLDPDMPRQRFQQLIGVIAGCGFQGVILSNTHKVDWPEAGGLSGHPLAVPSARMLEWSWEVHKGELGTIASGGILSGGDILQKVIRGASAVEIYTALVYRGPFAVVSLLAELQEEMKLQGISALQDVVGALY